jgi:hypothetical protein
MEKELIEPLEKTKITTSAENVSQGSSCCGGAPTNSADACCKLDEEKKAEGEVGCGCGTPVANDAKKVCC